MPAKVVHRAKALLDGGFVDRRENVRAFGPPGPGKTHRFCAVAQELVGSGRQVLFATCDPLVQEVLLAQKELQLPKALKGRGGYAALMADDLGHVQQSREEGGCCSRCWRSGTNAGAWCRRAIGRSRVGRRSSRIR